jgi:hypothetical protein
MYIGHRQRPRPHIKPHIPALRLAAATFAHGSHALPAVPQIKKL